MSRKIFKNLFYIQEFLEYFDLKKLWDDWPQGSGQRLGTIGQG
jgi:hypothetical protein